MAINGLGTASGSGFVSQATFDAGVGLVPIAPSSIANSGGSASLSGNTVTFSGVSSVSLNGCFSSTYDNYRVLVNGTTSVDGAQWLFRLRASGTDATGGNYNYGVGYINTATMGFNAGSTSGTSAIVNYGFVNNTTNSQQIGLEVETPFAATLTSITFVGQGGGLMLGFCRHGVASSYDGFTLFSSSGTLSGAVAVYGYKK